MVEVSSWPKSRILGVRRCSGMPATYQTVCPDEERLLRFVIWQLRYGELPADVRDAAMRLAPRYPREEEHLYLARNRHPAV